MLDCTTDSYNDIYAPWLAKPGELLALGDYKPGETLLDLCGGTGAVTKAALALGASTASITLLDLNPRITMLGVAVYKSRAEDLGRYAWEYFDLVVCRQAMGYLDPHRVFPAVATVLKPGGRFVFNTFQKPERYGWKQKSFEGHRFAEAHATFGKTVWHIQVRLGLIPRFDLSTFRYWSEEDLLPLLTADFKVALIQHGRGLHWLCIRKDTP